MKEFKLTIPSRLYETRTQRMAAGASYKLTENLRVGGGAPITWEEWTLISEGTFKMEEAQNDGYNVYFIGENTRTLKASKMIDVQYNYENRTIIIAVENRQKAMLFEFPEADIYIGSLDKDVDVITGIYYLLTGDVIEYVDPDDICPECGFRGVKGAKFCTSCGSQLIDDSFVEKIESKKGFGKNLWKGLFGKK